MTYLNSSKNIGDPRVEAEYAALRSECGGNECYKSMRALLGFFVNDRNFRTPENCDIINRLYYPPAEGETLKVPFYSCWRDFMIIKSAAIL